MEQNLIRCYNEKHQNHAIGVWLNNDKNIKKKDDDEKIDFIRKKID